MKNIITGRLRLQFPSFAALVLRVFKPFPSVLLSLFLVLTAPAAHAQKGINGNELFRLSPAELSTTIEAYKTLGVKWVRFDFDWSVMQPAPTTYNLVNHDRVVTALAKAQIKILGLIAYTPGWANGGQVSKFFPPTNPQTFASFAAFLTARYAGMGVAAWEIWNEPNLVQFWNPGADPAAYAQLLKQSYIAIKKQNPKMVVVSGGLGQPSTGGGNMEARLFLQLLYGSGAAPYFDAVGNHPYTAPQLPLDSSSNNWAQMFSTSTSFRSIMNQYGDDKKKIWITEYGAPTSGTNIWGTTVSEDRQASMVTQTLALTASYTWTGPTFWYNFKDFCAAGSSDSECYYGMVRSDGTAKPAFNAYRNAR
ncbi:cellulase family glycosylhydrolase [Massilia sp. LXY-6]|uniref:cellulase family glycosylhydrolase n=1 Tax=Massilia sp. LXY-6 TaxID=3379823 RepID=UPI003EE2827C